MKVAIPVNVNENTKLGVGEYNFYFKEKKILGVDIVEPALKIATAIVYYNVMGYEVVIPEYKIISQEPKKMMLKVFIKKNENVENPQIQFIPQALTIGVILGLIGIALYFLKDVLYRVEKIVEVAGLKVLPLLAGGFVALKYFKILK